MRVMVELDGLRAVISDLRSSGTREVDGAEVLDGNAGERIEASFVFEGTREELLGTARALDALMARLRAAQCGEANLPYDIEAPAVMATEWAT